MATKEDISTLVQSSNVDRIAAYARAGRKYASLSMEHLNLAWVATFRKMAENAADPNIRELHNDYDSEMSLRRAEPPFHLVKEEVESFCAAVDELAAGLKANHPDRIDEINAEIERDILDYKSSTRKAS